MTDSKDKTQKKKTLSLKLGAKPLIAPKKNIEAGKTVIVEKKRYKRGSYSETQNQKSDFKETSLPDKTGSQINEKSSNQNKSGVLLKPLSKDEQKRILKADSKKEKRDEIEKIRSGKQPSLKTKQNKILEEADSTKLDSYDSREIRKETDKKKNTDISSLIEDKKKTSKHFWA